MKNKSIPVTERGWYKKWYNNLSPQERAIEDRIRGIKVKNPTPVKNITKIYTDGCCIGNPGKGGYGVIIKHNDEEYELSCGFNNTTNNRMELRAVIDGLFALEHNEIVKSPYNIHIYSDSRYVTDAINKGWLNKWDKFGYKKNKDLWEMMHTLMILFENPKFHWIKGHNGHKENEACDKLAKQAVKNTSLISDSYAYTITKEGENPVYNKFRDTLRELGERYNAPDLVIKTYVDAHENFIDAVHAFIRNNTLK